MTLLYEQLLVTTPGEFVEIAPLSRTGTLTSKVRCVQSTQHTATLTYEWRGEGKCRKRRQWTCKVCSLLRHRVRENANAASYYCESCSEGSTKLRLCMKARGPSVSSHTCFEIWHEDFDSARSIPVDLDTAVKMRKVVARDHQSCKRPRSDEKPARETENESSETA